MTFSNPRIEYYITNLFIPGVRMRIETIKNDIMKTNRLYNGINNAGLNRDELTPKKSSAMCKIRT